MSRLGLMGKGAKRLTGTDLTDKWLGGAATGLAGATIGGLNAAFSNEVDNQWNSRGYSIFEGAAKGLMVGAIGGSILPVGRALRPNKYIQRDFGFDPRGMSGKEISLRMNKSLAESKEADNMIEYANKAYTMVANIGYMTAKESSQAIKKGLTSFAPSFTKEGRANKRAAIDQIKNSVNKATRAEMTEGKGSKASRALMLGVLGGGMMYGGYAASAMNAEAGHPYNAIGIARDGNRGQGVRAYQEAYEGAAIISSNPYQAGLRDTDEAYYHGAMRGSIEPISHGQRNRFSPGKFGDDGNLVFALNQIRRG